MKITLKTDVSSESGAEKSVAINFESAEIVKIASQHGVETANQAIDNLVEKYTLDIKKLITEILNK